MVVSCNNIKYKEWGSLVRASHNINASRYLGKSTNTFLEWFCTIKVSVIITIFQCGLTGGVVDGSNKQSANVIHIYDKFFVAVTFAMANNIFCCLVHKQPCICTNACTHAHRTSFIFGFHFTSGSFILNRRDNLNDDTN